MKNVTMSDVTSQCVVTRVPGGDMMGSIDQSNTGAVQDEVVTGHRTCRLVHVSQYQINILI